MVHKRRIGRRPRRRRQRGCLSAAVGPRLRCGRAPPTGAAAGRRPGARGRPPPARRRSPPQRARRRRRRPPPRPPPAAAAAAAGGGGRGAGVGGSAAPTSPALAHGPAALRVDDDRYRRRAVGRGRVGGRQWLARRPRSAQRRISTRRRRAPFPHAVARRALQNLRRSTRLASAHSQTHRTHARAPTRGRPSTLESGEEMPRVRPDRKSVV